MSVSSHPVSLEDRQAVETLLGRPPRGLVSIPVKTRQKEPVVIQVASLVDKKPFPTLFWLVDKSINYAIDQLEARGFIAELQSQIDQSSELQQTMEEDHQAHIQLRDSLIPAEQKQELEQLGFSKVLEHRGIGGIENFHRIRCLHTYYASHLVIPNTVGTLLDQHWQTQGHHFSHLPN